MITYFPEPYEDELAYSLFARFYMKSGYTTLRDVMDVLYVNKWYRADTLFFNKLKPEVVDIITRNISMKEFVERHTMFPYYARFIKKERREKAVQSMINMDGNYHNLLPITNGIHGRYLRYCPGCVKYDRENYGETYWHRIHQMDGISVCPIHKCMLVNSSIAVGVKDSAGLITAEQAVDEVIPEYSYDEIKNKLAEYVMMVFLADVNYEANGIGSFLRERLDAKYLSNTGVTMRVGEFLNDFNTYFGSNLSGMDFERIQKIYNGYRWNGYEICCMGVFQQISIKDLVNFKSDRHDALEDTYKRIALEYGLSSSVVSAIGTEIIVAYEKLSIRKKSGVKQQKWQELDIKYLSDLKVCIEQTLQNEQERPVKICTYWACRKLGISSKQMEKLPLCKKEIEQYAETQEHYWAREIIWAIHKIDNSGIELCWRRVRELTNIRKVNCEEALSIIEKLTDATTYERIRQLL